jgi:hypothetical protein
VDVAHHLYSLQWRLVFQLSDLAGVFTGPEHQNTALENFLVDHSKENQPNTDNSNQGNAERQQGGPAPYL